jgi:hypothetical protein
MSIRLSEKHGVNPAIPKCYFCGEDKNEVILAGKMRGDVEAPRGVAWDMNPCDKCEDMMQQGIMVLSIRDGEGDRMAVEQEAHEHRRNDVARGPSYKHPPFMPNPYRTGGFWVLREEAFKRALVEGLGAPEATVNRMIKMRWAYLDDKICRAVGLELSGGVDGEDKEGGA